MTSLLEIPPVRPTDIHLRGYQKDAIDAVRNEYLKGIRSTLLVMATGLGKTVSFGMVARMVAEKGGRTLVLAHRGELIEQAAETLTRIGLDPGIEKANSFARAIYEPNVVVATVQTMQRERLQTWPRDFFKLVIVDECHHSTAKSYRNILDHFSSARVLGVTATAERVDDDALGDVFESVAYEYTLWEAMTAPAPGPYLSRLRFVQCDVGIDLRDIRTTAGDLNAADLEEAIRPHIETLANAIKQEIGDRKTLIFTPDVGSAMAMASALNGELGIRSRWVSGESPDRKAIIDGFKRGDFQALANCSLLLEGFDCPSVSAIALCRPTKSRPLYTQIVGRGTRLCNGKENCIAEGELVLTDFGLVPIEFVTTAMKVWDGLEFVSHDGVICQGEQEVITYAGLTATPDHKVWTDRGWKSFGECAEEATPIRVTGIAGHAVRETDGRHRRDPERRPAREGKDRGSVPMRPPVGEGLFFGDPRDRGMSNLRQSATCAVLALPACHFGPPAMHQSERSGLSPLWRSRDRVPVRGRHLDGIVGPGEPRASQGHDDRQDRQRGALRGGKSPVSDQSAELLQHAAETSRLGDACLPSRTSGDPLCGSHAQEDALRRDVLGRDHRPIPPAIEQTKRRVWDILNAGPRHRFTVSGLLVSNCLLIDFAWLTAKHDLVKPTELFGSTASDPETASIAEEVMKKKKGLDLHDVIEEAKEEKRRRTELRIKAKQRELKYRKVAYDPLTQMGVLGLKVPKSATSNQGTVTGYQRERLERWGFKGVESMSKSQASRVIDQYGQRLRQGLATMKQVNVLLRSGMPAEEARTKTIREASDLIDVIMNGKKAGPAMPPPPAEEEVTTWVA